MSRRVDVLSLPPELLSLVFEQVYEDISRVQLDYRFHPVSGNDYRSNLSPTLTSTCLSHVCSVFRRVALGMPRLWSFISVAVGFKGSQNIFGMNEEWVQVLLDRSADQGLHVEFSSSGYCDRFTTSNDTILIRDADSPSRPCNCMQVLHKLLEHTRRWEIVAFFNSKLDPHPAGYRNYYPKCKLKWLLSALNLPRLRFLRFLPPPCNKSWSIMSCICLDTINLLSDIVSTWPMQNLKVLGYDFVHMWSEFRGQVPILTRLAISNVSWKTRSPHLSKLELSVNVSISTWQFSLADRLQEHLSRPTSYTDNLHIDHLEIAFYGKFRPLRTRFTNEPIVVDSICKLGVRIISRSSGVCCKYLDQFWVFPNMKTLHLSIDPFLSNSGSDSNPTQVLDDTPDLTVNFQNMTIETLRHVSFLASNHPIFDILHWLTSTPPPPSSRYLTRTLDQVFPNLEEVEFDLRVDEKSDKMLRQWVEAQVSRKGILVRWTRDTGGL